MKPADKAREIVDECCGTCSSPDCECDKRQMEALITQALIESAQEKDFWREECGKLKEALTRVSSGKIYETKNKYHSTLEAIIANEALSAYESRCQEKMGKK